MKRLFTLCSFLLLWPAFSVKGQDTWEQKNALPAAGRYSQASFVIGDKLYMGTGSNESGYLQDWWMYDTKLNQWTPKNDFPGGARTAATGFSIGNKGYLCFGSNTPGDVNWIWYKDLWQYDPENDSWTKLQDFPGQARFNAVSFVIGNKAYVGTGNYRFNRWTNATYLNDFWEYDPATDHWTQKTAVPEEGRAGALALSIMDKGYIGLGFYYYDTRKKDWWQYDPAIDQWSRKADLPGEPRYNAAGFAIDQKGFVIGGANYSPLNDNWAYDPLTDSWTLKATFPGSARYAALAFASGNKGYYGLGAWATYLTDLWKYSGELITMNCPADQELYARTEGGCSQWVYGLDPVFIPANASPVLNYQHIWKGSVVRSGNGVLTNTTFPVGDNYLVYTLPDEGNQRCTTRIKILDTIKPILVAPPDQQFCFTPTARYSIPWMQYSDNCDLPFGGYVGYSITGATVRTGMGPNASGMFQPGQSVIHWKVVDPSGNTTEKSTVVNIGASLKAQIPTSASVLFGAPNTVYIGYGFGGIPMSVTVTGGTPYPGNNYKYQWSNGSSSQLAWLRPPAIPGYYMYQVVVTDAWGCSTSAEVLITVKDVRCGHQGNKVLVCKNTRQGPREYCLSTWEATLALFNGAKLGSCELLTVPENENGAIKEDVLLMNPVLRISPNPNSGAFELIMSGFDPDRYNVETLDMRGRVIRISQINVATSYLRVPMNVGAVAKGPLLVRVYSKKGVWTVKVLVQ